MDTFPEDAITKAKTIVDSPIPSNSTLSQEPLGTIVYASFWRRWGAIILDGLILGIPMMVVQGILGTIILGAAPAATMKAPLTAVGVAGGNIGAIYPLVGVMVMWVIIIFLLSVCYYVIGLAIWGKTVGKKIMKIKVVRADNMELIGYGKALLRETVGKWLSSWIFNLGFLWMIWDPKKQTWHDKIVGTIVIKDN